jgi:hypothetical protein
MKLLIPIDDLGDPNGQQGVCHTLALPFTFKSILRQKKNDGNSKYFTMPKL